MSAYVCIYKWLPFILFTTFNSYDSFRQAIWIASGVSCCTQLLPVKACKLQQNHFISITFTTTQSSRMYIIVITIHIISKLHRFLLFYNLTKSFWVPSEAHMIETIEYFEHFDFSFFTARVAASSINSLFCWCLCDVFYSYRFCCQHAASYMHNAKIIRWKLILILFCSAQQLWFWKNSSVISNTCFIHVYEMTDFEGDYGNFIVFFSLYLRLLLLQHSVLC